MSIKDLEQIRTLLKLKEVERFTIVKERQESTAEHSWACMILADYFLTKHPELHREKVMDLLMYHDLVEIEAGDTNWLDPDKEAKEKREEEGFLRLKKKIPSSLAEKYHRLHHEYIEHKTQEAKFAHAIDKLEPCIHYLDYPKEWHKMKLTEALIREKKQPSFEPFPEIMEFWEDLIIFLKKNNYLRKA